MIDALLSRIETATTPEKVAENDHLVRCRLFPVQLSYFTTKYRFQGIMRVIITARQALTSVYELTLGRLVTILGVISKNPSNPRFDQYIFESISGLMRYPISSFYKDIGSETPQIHRDRLPCNATNI